MRLIFAFFLSFLSVFAFDLQSIDAGFVQTITSPQKDKIVYRGSFYAKKPDLALWKYLEPVQKFIYLRGKKILIVEPELEQVIYSKIEDVPNITKILQKSKKIAKNTYEARLKGEKYIIVFKQNKPHSISYKDKLENDVKIEFFKTKTNIFLDDSLFKFVVPKGYDVLKE